MTSAPPQSPLHAVPAGSGPAAGARVSGARVLALLLLAPVLALPGVAGGVWLVLIAGSVGALLGDGPGARRGWACASGVLVGALMVWSLPGGTPAPWAAGAVAAGLTLLGCASARVLGSPVTCATWWCLLAACACFAPHAADILGPAPLAPRHAALLLDLAPSTWALEGAGLDWMRHPAVYDRVGTSGMGPGVRQAVGSGPALLLLLSGCAACLLPLRLRREPT